MKRSFAATLALAAALVCALPASGQQADQGETAAWTAADEDRSVILRFLERDDVGAAARSMGYDAEDIGHAVLGLEDADATRLAADVRSAEEAMAAQTISFTVTTLIIILLVIILLVLVVD